MSLSSQMSKTRLDTRVSETRGWTRESLTYKMLMRFLSLTPPASKNEKPACMNMTKNPVVACSQTHKAHEIERFGRVKLTTQKDPCRIQTVDHLRDSLIQFCC